MQNSVEYLNDIYYFIYYVAFDYFKDAFNNYVKIDSRTDL